MAFGFSPLQSKRCLVMALRMMSSLRMWAVRVTLFGVTGDHRPPVKVLDAESRPGSSRGDAFHGG